MIPGSTNTWEQIIDAAAPEDMVPYTVLSGNMVIESHFMDGLNEVGTASMRVYYD